MERVDPGTMAYTFSEHVADTEADPGEYLQRFLDELLVLEPTLREHFSDTLLGELKEEVVRREDSRHSRAVVALVLYLTLDPSQTLFLGGIGASHPRLAERFLVSVQASQDFLSLPVTVLHPDLLYSCR